MLISSKRKKSNYFRYIYIYLFQFPQSWKYFTDGFISRKRKKVQWLISFAKVKNTSKRNFKFCKLSKTVYISKKWKVIFYVHLHIAWTASAKSRNVRGASHQPAFMAWLFVTCVSSVYLVVDEFSSCALWLLLIGLMLTFFSHGEYDFT